MTTPTAAQSIPATTSARAAELGYKSETTCAINVTDLKSSSKWYQDLLGFTPLHRMEEIGCCEFLTNVPGTTVGLSLVEPDSNDAPGPGGATLTFGVFDIEESRKLLEAKDVRFDGETREIAGMVTLATFFDADGNAFMLAQELTED